MPDHCHWVLQLGERLILGQVVAKFKSLTKHHLAVRQLAWQRNYYEHQLRPEESIEDYSLYVFLNPYRALLVPADQPWSGWWSGTPESLRFAALLGDNGGPPKEWIGHPVPDGLVTGE
jgi:putative transposase